VKNLANERPGATFVSKRVVFPVRFCRSASSIKECSERLPFAATPRKPIMMRRSVLPVFFALFVLSGIAQAAVSGSISPNNIANVGTTTVTLTGLQPNTTYDVQFIGVGTDGQVSNTTRQVTTNAEGEASWNETVAWGADSYSTVVDFRPSGGSGHWSSEATGTLTVT
jgi:hypothetical protein